MSEDKVIPVKVALRCRPLIPKETSECCQMCVRFVPGEHQIIVGKDKAFTYDYVFSPSDTQNEVYEKSVKSVITNVFKGYNATVLAYGQTGSGKTYTMSGVIPQILHEFFQTLKEKSAEFEYSIKVSYIEIYNEELKDLLCPANKKEQLTIREELSGGIKIQGLHEANVHTFDDTMKQLDNGAHGRTVGATAMNSESSRSHAIFTMHFEQRKKDDTDDVCKCKIHLVDLAGSERAKKTNAEGERFKEGVNINRGLLALGNVISALGEESQKRNFIPYRDSKLTRLLQDSLGGNSHTLMIACISPADSNLEETINTLRYADRARKIKNKPVVNRDPQSAEIIRLRQLVQQLQSQLAGSELTSPSPAFTENGMMTSLSTTSSTFDSSEEYKAVMVKYKAIEDENSKLSHELQRAVDQNARMCESYIKLEMKRDKLFKKFQDLQQQDGIDFDVLSASVDMDGNPEMKEQLEKLKNFTDTLKSDQFSDEKEEETCIFDDNTENEQDEDTTPETPDSRVISTQYALRRAEMSKELQELNRLLSKKEELANQMTTNDDKMQIMRTEFAQSRKMLESEIDSLQKEKDDLSLALQNAKSNSAASKVSEQRRKRLQELEHNLTDLKKKLTEQSKIVKLKEQTDKQVSRLNSDIQALKQQRVKLMKQMKEDGDNFRKWKQKKDKEVNQLIQKDRKRQCEMQRMKKSHEKQQMVFKRKADEAASANKRLKDALARQKQVLNERNQKLEKYDATTIGNRVRSWLSHELDVRVSVKDAKFHLESLLNDRKTLSKELTDLKDKLEDEPPMKRLAFGEKGEMSFEKEDLKHQIANLESEIELRNTQISDFQQKIMDAEQDSGGKSVWESLHTMVEAKCALKWLMEQASTARVDYSRAESELKEYKSCHEDDNKSSEFEKEMKDLRQTHQEEIDRLRRQHEDKVLFLLRQFKTEKNNIRNNCMDGETKERLQIQESEIERLSKIHEELQEKAMECETLKQQLTRAMYQGRTMNLMPSIKEPGTSPFLSPTPKQKPPKKAPIKKVEIYESEEESDWSSPSENDDDDDSDFRMTPFLNRQRQKRTADGSHVNANQGQKRTSNGNRCSCTLDCSTRRCVCQKSNGSCTSKCRCQKSKCKNRKPDGEETTCSMDQSDDTTLNSTYNVPEDEASVKEGNVTKKNIFKELDSTNNVRSSCEFDVPKGKAARKKKDKGAENNEDDMTSELAGGMKRRRKLLSSSVGTFFGPLS